MTQQDSDKLAALQAAVDAAQAKYDTEASDNYLAHTGASNGGDYQGKTAAWWTQWAHDSDNSLSLKKGILTRAQNDLAAFSAQLDKNSQNALATSNPDLYASIQKNKDSVEADAKAKIAQAAASAANYAAANSKYIIIAVVLIVAGLIFYFANRKKTA